MVKRDNGAWAEQVIERNGKFYMYCPIHGNGIGVLVADSPYGPFKDPLNKPLVWQKEHWDDIDPQCSLMMMVRLICIGEIPMFIM